MTLYEALKQAKCVMHNHESDLYILATSTSIGIINQFRKEDEVLRANISTFKSEADGMIYFEVPFNYDPFWKK